jgi:hypothetical protein
LRFSDAEPEPRGIVRNLWKGQGSGQDVVVAEPSRKEYSCHLSLQNDGNYCTAMGCRQASGMRVHQLFEPCITFIPFDVPIAAVCFESRNKDSFFFNKTHDLKRITQRARCGHCSPATMPTGAPDDSKKPEPNSLFCRCGFGHDLSSSLLCPRNNDKLSIEPDVSPG